MILASQLINKGVKIDYIMTDFMMPRLNGIQAVQKIKHFIQAQNSIRPDDPIPEPRFVFLTAYKTSVFDKLIKELNVDTVFEKPLSLEQL